MCIRDRYFAWVDSDKEYKSDVIHLMNLKNASVYDIKAKKGAYILPLGFIDEDFIYGAAKKDKVMVAAAGNTVFPMKNLTIMDTSENSHSILKTVSYTHIDVYKRQVMNAPSGKKKCSMRHG